MAERKDSSWFILLETLLAVEDREAAACAWVSSIVPRMWQLASSGEPERRPDWLRFRWGSDGEQRDERWAFVDLRDAKAAADGTVTLGAPGSSRCVLHLTLKNASSALARATFRALALASGDARGFLAELGVGSSAADALGQGGATEVGWLSVLPGDLTQSGGPYRRSERVDARTLIEAYGEDEPNKRERLGDLDAWLRRPPEVAAAPLEEPAPVGPETPSRQVLASPSYMVRAPESDPKPREASPPVASTEAIDLRKLREALARATTPFAGATSPERLAELRQAAPGADLTALPVAPESGDDGDSTMMLPTSALLGQLAATPFAASLASTAFPDLSVDRYAALCAELEAKGPTPEVLRRYDIPTAAALRALHDEQARRFGADPALRARFDERVAHFLSFLRPKD